MPNTHESLPRTTPEAEGVASEALLAFINALDDRKLELHSLMLLRRGNVLAEGWWAPYTAPAPHMLYSLSKSFLSTAAGLAIAEGYFAVTDPVTHFFPDDLPPVVSDNLAAMQVRHLLSMATGHAEDQTGALRGDPDGNWPRAFLAQAVEHEPGTFFRYNSAATYMVSAILQKTTGITALEFLRPRLLLPLGITDATWETDPRGVSVGGWGLRIRTEDIARFGEMYRRRGFFNEQQLVPSDWVEAATRAQVSNGDPATDSDWAQGYGYQFWRCQHGAFRGDGAFGQFCVVLPQQEAVLVTTANVAEMQTVLNLVWEILLPAMTPAGPVPENAESQKRLHDRLANLQIPPPVGAKTSETAARIQGRTYRFGENEQGIVSVTLTFTVDTVTLIAEDTAGAHSVVGGLGDWHEGTTSFLQNWFARSLPSNPAGDSGESVSACAAWTDKQTLALRLCLTHTPFTPTIVCRFTDDTHLQLEIQGRISFGPTERPVLEGTAE